MEKGKEQNKKQIKKRWRRGRKRRRQKIDSGQEEKTKKRDRKG